MRIVGVVLAGGRSTRFGSEKALAEVGGVPMIGRAAGVLADCELVGLSARPGSGAAAWGAARGWPVLHDAAGHADGPLAGVHAGLVWAMKMGADALATAPCDTPFLPADLIARLASALSDAPGAVAAASPGRIEPLCALWTTSLLSDLTAALAQGRHPAIHTLVTELGFAVVNFGAPAAFANINTTADLR